MKKSVILFLIILIITIIVPLVSVVQTNINTNSTTKSKQMVTIFNTEESFCGGIIDF